MDIGKNLARARRARAALRCYVERAGTTQGSVALDEALDETDVIDLVTDLYHLCHQNGWPFDPRIAQGHFMEEAGLA